MVSFDVKCVCGCSLDIGAHSSSGMLMQPPLVNKSHKEVSDAICVLIVCALVSLGTATLVMSGESLKILLPTPIVQELLHIKPKSFSFHLDAVRLSVSNAGH
jgi:hypothetical protein